MIINQVSMHNFIAYSDALVSFPLGVTVIVGQNGAGKTSILEAVTYSLFKEHGRGVEENLIRRGRDKAKVSVRFSVRGRKYEVEWTLQRGRTSVGRLQDLDKQMPVVMPGIGERTVVPAVEKIMGLDSKIFMNAIYVRQGQIAKLLEDRPAERKRTVAHLLGVDELEKIWEALKKPIDDLKQELNIYQSQLERASSLEKQLLEKTALLEESMQKLETIAAEMEVFDEQARRLEQEVEEMERRRRRDEQIGREIIILKARLENMKTEKKTLDERVQELEVACEQLEANRPNYLEYIQLDNHLKAHAASLSEAEKQLESKKPAKTVLERRKVEAESYSKQISEYLANIRQITGDTVDVSNAAAVWQRTMADISERIGEKDQEIAVLSSRRNNYGVLAAVSATTLTLASIFIYLTTQNIITLLLNIPSVLAYLVLNRMKSRVDKQIQNLAAERYELFSRRTQLEKVEPTSFLKTVQKYKQVAEEMGRLQPAAMEAESLENRLSMLRSEMQKVRYRLEELQPSRDRYAAASSALEKYRLQDIERLKQYIKQLQQQSEQYASDMDETMSAIGRLEAEKQSIAYSEETHERTSKQYEKALEDKAKAEREHAVLSNTIHHLKQDVEQLQTQLDELAKTREKHDKLESYVLSLDKVRDVFHKDGVLQKIIRKQASTSIERIARLFLREFDLQFDDIKIDEDFDVKVYGRNGEQTVDTLSGGEKLVVAIVLRLAVAAALAGEKLESIIMDEPTIHLDTERRRQLVNVLKNFRGGGRLIPQVIVVSHDRELIEAADQVYEVTASEKGSELRQEIP